MGFPAQGDKGQISILNQRMGVFVSVNLLAFIDDRYAELFAVEGENAPGAVGPFEYANYASFLFFPTAKTFKALHGFGGETNAAKNRKWVHQRFAGDPDVHAAT